MTVLVHDDDAGFELRAAGRRPRDDRSVRRLLVEGTPYAVFYSVDREATEVLIAAVWSRARGSDPPVL